MVSKWFSIVDFSTIVRPLFNEIGACMRCFNYPDIALVARPRPAGAYDYSIKLESTILLNSRSIRENVDSKSRTYHLLWKDQQMDYCANL